MDQRAARPDALRAQAAAAAYGRSFDVPVILEHKYDLTDERRRRNSFNAAPDDPAEKFAEIGGARLFGGATMGVDPKTSVVGPDFATHEVAGLYVVDSSVFPTNLGVNPQHSIMAMSRLAATGIAAGGRARTAA